MMRWISHVLPNTHFTYNKTVKNNTMPLIAFTIEQNAMSNYSISKSGLLFSFGLQELPLLCHLLCISVNVFL